MFLSLCSFHTQADALRMSMDSAYNKIFGKSEDSENEDDLRFLSQGVAPGNSFSDEMSET